MHFYVFPLSVVLLRQAEGAGSTGAPNRALKSCSELVCLLQALVSHLSLQAAPERGGKQECFVKESLDKTRKVFSPGVPQHSYLYSGARARCPPPGNQQEVFITDPEKVVVEVELLNASHLRCQGRKT